MNITTPSTGAMSATGPVSASSAAPTPTLEKKMAATPALADAPAVKPASAAPAAAAAPVKANRRLAGTRPAVQPVATGTAKTAVKKPVTPVAAPAIAPAVNARSAKPAPKTRLTEAASAKVPPNKLPAPAKASAAPKLPAAPAPDSQAAATVAPATAAKPVRSTKDKLVRDSFTMPRADFALIQQLKERALGFKRATKKSELLRAGLQALAGMSAAQLQAQLGKLVTIKAGRPKKAV